MADHYQLLVIGAGPGGYVAALKAAQLGARVAVVEKHHLGGTCLNYGCIPSKALLSSAEMLHYDAAGRQMGREGRRRRRLRLVGDHRPQGQNDSPTARRHRQLAQGPSGHAACRHRAASMHRVDVAVTAADGSQQLVTADKVIIATGSAPMRIPGWPDDPRFVCTSDEAVHWTDLPKQLLIVGGGVIGCEFACMMQSFGVEVTIVEMMPRLLPTLDADLGERVAEDFSAARSIVCHLDTKVEEVRIAGEAVNVPALDRRVARVRPRAGGDRPTAEHERTGARRAGIRTDRRGFVEVNDRLETSAAGPLHDRRRERPQHAGPRGIGPGRRSRGECARARPSRSTRRFRRRSTHSPKSPRSG